MKAADYLKNYKIYNDKVKVINNNLVGVKGISFEDKYPSYKTKVDYIQEKDELISKMKEIEDVVYSLENHSQREVIDFIYLQFLKVKEVAFYTSYSESSVRRIEKEGLKEVEKIINEKE